MGWNSVIARNNLVSTWIQDHIKVIGGLMVAASVANIWLSKGVWQIQIISAIMMIYSLKKWAYGFIPIARKLDKIYRSVFGWNVGDEVVIHLPYGYKEAGTVIACPTPFSSIITYDVRVNNNKITYAEPSQMESYAYSDY